MQSCATRKTARQHSSINCAEEPAGLLLLLLLLLLLCKSAAVLHCCCQLSSWGECWCYLRFELLITCAEMDCALAP
jgi:hypothetical protein